MAGTTSSKIASIMVVLPLLALIYFLAPMALPVWRWKNLDFQELSKKTGVKEALLKKEYDVIVRYQPREKPGGGEDPMPFQLITMNPTWSSVDEKNNDEDHLLVRCTFISDRSGEGPSKLYLGSTYKDRYFRAHGWRFPPGSFGFNKHRPVFVYQGDTFEKLSIADAEMQSSELDHGKWTNDDKEVDDGFSPAR